MLGVASDLSIRLVGAEDLDALASAWSELQLEGNRADERYRARPDALGGQPSACRALVRPRCHAGWLPRRDGP